MLIYLDRVRVSFPLCEESRLKRLPYLDNLLIPHIITNDIKEFVNHPDPTKIAVLYHRFTLQQEDREFLNKYYNQIKNISRLVFFVETDLEHGEIFDEYVNNNVYAVVPGFSNKDNTNVIFKSQWLEILVDLYQQLPWVLEKINYTSQKPYYFDALLGTKKPNRDIIYSLIEKNNLNDKFILNYDISKFIMEPGTVINSRFTTTIGHSSITATYYNIDSHLSCIIPAEIYNKTAYSIVAETKGDDLRFYTEKIFKPIIARRLFVVFAQTGYLEGLRSMGFKTFGDIIDESYDDIIDNTQRWAKAFEQVKYLCSLDQITVLNKIKSTVEHNHQLAMSKNLTKKAISVIINKINGLV